MCRLLLALAIATVGWGWPPPAHADLGSAFKAYDAREFEVAYREFLQLAELGSALAQANTGMMLLNGEGVPANSVVGYGWILAASDNESGMAAQLAQELQGKFNAEQTAAAQRYVENYGRAAVRERLFPTLSDTETAAAVRRAEPQGVQRLTFPEKAREHGTVGMIEVAAILGTDGRVHDTWITASLPSGVFDESVLEAMREWRHTPATVDDSPVPIAYARQHRFVYVGEDESTRPRVQRFVRERRAEAIAGTKPAAQYVLARLLMMFPDLRVEEGEISRLLGEAAQKGHPPSQQFLGTCILRGEGTCGDRPRSEGVEFVARAAQSGDPASQLVMALLLLAHVDAQSHSKALRWLEAGTRSGHVHSAKYLASLLAASPVAEIRNPQRARQLIEPLTRAGALPDDPDVWQIHAAALGGESAFDAAVKSQERALKLASRWGWNTAPFEARLAAYRGSSAWYGDLLGLAGLRWAPAPAGGTKETCSEVAEAGSRLSRCVRKTQGN